MEKQLNTMTPEQFEGKFNIKKSTQANWRSAGKLPYAKIGKKVIYFVDDIEKMLEKHRVQVA